MKNDFAQYVYSFYGQNGLYSDFFKTPVTMERIDRATQTRQNHPKLRNIPFDGDSYDRELVRDIMLKEEDPVALTEHI